MRFHELEIITPIGLKQSQDAYNLQKPLELVTNLKQKYCFEVETVEAADPMVLSGTVNKISNDVIDLTESGHAKLQVDRPRGGGYIAKLIIEQRQT